LKIYILFVISLYKYTEFQMSLTSNKKIYSSAL